MKVLDYKFVPATHDSAIKVIERFGYQNLNDMKYQLRGDISDYDEWSNLTLPINRFELEDDNLFEELPSDLGMNTVFIYGSPEQRVLVCSIKQFLSESGYDEDEIKVACSAADIG